MLVFLTLILCLTTALVLYLRALHARYSYFQQHNIPTPSFAFFFGHFKAMWSSEQLTRQLQRWTQQYGSIYGLFLGTRPMYVVSDVNFLQEVFIKQFSSFHSRRVPFLMRTLNHHYTHLLAATGAVWQRQRHVLNPAFTAAKLKGMTSTIYECIDSLTRKLEEQDGEVNIYTLYKRLTMDVICKSLSIKHCTIHSVTSFHQAVVRSEWLQICRTMLKMNT